MRHLALVLFLAAAPIQARAQTPCPDRAAVVERLQTEFGETQQALGLIGPQGVLEFWANSKTGTWTALLSNHLGQSCVLASGSDWALVPAPPVPEGDPA